MGESYTTDLATDSSIMRKCLSEKVARSETLRRGVDDGWLHQAFNHTRFGGKIADLTKEQLKTIERDVQTRIEVDRSELSGLNGLSGLFCSPRAAATRPRRRLNAKSSPMHR